MLTETIFNIVSYSHAKVHNSTKETLWKGYDAFLVL